MQTIQLTSGSQVPVLGYGTWQLDSEQCFQGVTAALNCGYRHIDTAEVYGNEADVGRAIRQSGVARADIFLTTKVFRPNVAPQKVGPEVEASLQRLQTDYVDLLLIHWPVDDVPVEETLAEFAKLQQAGKVKNIGVSNFTVAQMERARATGTTIVTNQVEYHPMLNQQPVLEYCRANGMFLTAYSPLAQGQATGDSIIQSIAQKHGKTAAQVCLRWLIQQPGVVAIPRSTKAENIQANLEVFNFTLDDADNAAIAALPKNHRTVNPPFAPQWDQAA